MLQLRKPKDWLQILILTGIALLIYYPIISRFYAYTDEVVQLWNYRKGSSFNMFVSQGRFITDELFRFLFSSINTIDEIHFIRMFSLAGWIVCIPIWYFIIKRVGSKYGAAPWLPFLTCLYLICCPSFTLYVSWASCLELFLASTSGLVSGYFTFKAFNENISIGRKIFLLLASLVAALISLFTYQFGFCCFLIPFSLQLFFDKSIHKQLLIAVGWYLLLYAIYYLLFKIQMSVLDIPITERGSISLNPVEKFKLVFTRALPASLNFTLILNEVSILRLLISTILIAGWGISVLFFQKWKTMGSRITYIIAVLVLIPLLYVPGLIVKENYASNRTLLAMNMVVWLLVLVFINQTTIAERLKKIFIAGASFLLIVTAAYNFRFVFLKPVSEEYRLMAGNFEKNYKPGIDTVIYLRPPEDFFVRKYGLRRSWDEFGVPSGFFDWVPESQTKQWIYQMTKDRSLAEKIVVKHTLDPNEYKAMLQQAGANTIAIDEEAVLNGQSTVK